MICNGHGEDLIALRVLEQIHSLQPRLTLEVLPLVGRGSAFDAATEAGWLRRIGPSASLPSGGFSNQSFSGLLADLRAGLPLLSLRQWLLVGRRARAGCRLLAIGDLLPLLMAWSSGALYGFIGTPKSDYTWRSGPGNSPSDRYHRLKGSEWDPWEWILMGHGRCKLVATRDALTARGLNRHRVRALAPGNPMMDGLVQTEVPPSLARCRRVLLLCGSRMPEACRNFQRLMAGIGRLQTTIPIAILAAVGPQPSVDALERVLVEQNFRRGLPPSDQLGAAACWVKGPLMLLIGVKRFKEWAGWAEAGVATAGTATEQLVGLGIPTLSSPGPGPQFHWPFARRQSRLLGGAVHPCGTADELGQRLEQLLSDPLLRERLGRIGRRRMGPPGGSARIAELVLERLHGY